MAASSSSNDIVENAHAGDSDFDSSDLDEVLMSMGTQQDGCEAARTARVWGQRAHKKRKRRRKEGKSQLQDALAELPISENSDDEPSTKRYGGDTLKTPSHTRGGSSLPAHLSDQSRALFVRGQAQFANGDFDDAIESMRTVIRLEPGLPEPFHILTLVYKERGEVRKALDAMLMAAYFTPGADGRALWRRVGNEAKELGLVDQACYAYKRSIGGRGAKTPEELQSKWELSQLLFQKGRYDEGVVQLHAIYKETGEDRFAIEAATKLVTRRRWRECLELLGGCVERGRASQDGLNMHVLNMYCEVLMEVREFERCKDLLAEVLKLRGASDEGTSTRLRKKTKDCSNPSLSVEELTARMVKQPIDLVAKFAAACCHLRTENSKEPDAMSSCAIEVVLLQPADNTSDLYLSIIDALLTNENSTAKKSESQSSGDASPCLWPARYALRILDVLAESEPDDDDVKERRAQCLWQLGQSKDAAMLWEDVFELGGERSEHEQKELGIRIAEAWYACGQPERADKYIKHLGFDDLQRTKLLPKAMSSEQRRAKYTELNAIVDRFVKYSSSNQLEWDDLQDFAHRFHHLVLDCELDKARLTRFTQARASSLAAAAVAEEQDAEEAPLAIADVGDAANDEEKDAEHRTQEAASSCGIVAVRNLENKEHTLQVLDNVSVSHKFKLHHLGYESIEDLFGFEAYIEFLIKGLSLLQSCKFGYDKGAGLRNRALEISRIVDVCEMVAQNRPLVAMRNPVKRHLLRALALKNVSLAFEARNWPIVFKHLRLMCNNSVDDGPLALFSRVIFTDPELHLPPPKTANKQADPAPWNKPHQAVSASGHRTTYAASLVDVRSWALRQLLRKPKSYGFTLLAGHFCIAASQYPLALAEYSRAHRLAPFDAMTCLCLASAYLSFAMSRTACDRHDLVLKGFAFLQRYRRLRLQAVVQNDETQSVPLGDLVLCAEAEYNYGRGFHQLGIYYLAAKAYRNALEICEKAPLDEPEVALRPDFLSVRRASAYNLSSLYKAQGSMDMARETLWRHVVF